MYMYLIFVHVIHVFVLRYLSQEQLKIVGLISALQVEEEVRGREKQLDTLLRNKKTMKVCTYQ